MRIDEYPQRMRAAMRARGGEAVRGSVWWEAFVAVAREPVETPHAGARESFELEVEAFERSVIASLRRRLIYGNGDRVDATTFHCELVFERPTSWDDGFAVVLDEDTEPPILSLDDLDRHGRATPAMQLLFLRCPMVNVFTDGAT